MPFESYKNSRILVTGGAGFIGSHICERLLDAGAEVACADNYFTGSRRNIAHLIANPMFEAVRHDATKAKVALNSEPKVALEDGLKQTIAYFKHALEIA